MLSQPLPDLAATLRLQTQTASTRTQLQAAAQELTTGLTADIRGLTGGDLSPVFALDRDIQAAELRIQDLSLAGGRATAAQAALGQVQGSVGTLGLDIEAAISRGDPVSTTEFLNQAAPALSNIVSTLNTSFGGRSLFAGAAEDTRPLTDAGAIVADLGAILAAAPDATTAIADIDAYFGVGGGFETAIYQGSTTDAAAAELSDGTRVTYLPRADDPALRELIQGTAMMAALPAAGFGGDEAEVTAFLSDAAGRLQAGPDDIVDLRANLGIAEEQVERALATAGAERSGLQIARNDMIGVDSFDAATRLAGLEAQLETLYTVTARLSTLRLTNFLR